MGTGDSGGSDSQELQPIVDELAVAAREAHTELRSELRSLDGGIEAEQTDVADLREGIETTRQYVRKLEQYVVALEEAADEGE